MVLFIAVIILPLTLFLKGGVGWIGGRPFLIDQGGNKATSSIELNRLEVEICKNYNSCYGRVGG